MKIAVHQMCSGIDAAQNAKTIVQNIARAAKEGAAQYFAPEMSGLIDRERERAAKSIGSEEDNIVLSATKQACRESKIWAHLGSLPIRADKSALISNRTFVIDALGQVRARYDKMHLFDVDLSTGEKWRESAAYAPGGKTVLVDSPLGVMGLAICYDLRFPKLFNIMRDAGAGVFAIPAAFTVPTGAAHWHILLRARAIENAVFVIAAAQTGQHADGRETYGHSLVVDPWGEIVLDMGIEEGLGFADIDLARIDEVRAQIPVHQNQRPIPAPKPLDG
jgi:deaminated glutathione amidase